ncbi:MAG: helix-turn-helix domain-containing protein [Bergeyella sp.]
MNNKKIHTAKTSHTGNFNLLIEELVQTKVTELLDDYSERLFQAENLSTTKDVLNIKDVAELLDMNERVVRDKINLGLIPAYKCSITNKFFILKQELIQEIISGIQYKSLSMINAEMNRSFDARKYV